MEVDPFLKYLRGPLKVKKFPLSLDCYYIVCLCTIGMKPVGVLQTQFPLI